MRSDFYSVHTKCNANILIKFDKGIKFGALPFVPKEKRRSDEWSTHTSQAYWSSGLNCTDTIWILIAECGCALTDQETDRCNWTCQEFQMLHLRISSSKRTNLKAAIRIAFSHLGNAPFLHSTPILSQTLLKSIGRFRSVKHGQCLFRSIK